jgi:hypothetical protein
VSVGVAVPVTCWTAGAVLHILLRAVLATLRESSPTAPADASLGAVSFLHRFGSSLNPHFHFHLCVVDGLFHRVEDDTNQDPANPETSLRFHEATALTQELLEGLQHTVRKRVLRHFRRHGLLEPHDAEDMLTWDHGGGFSLDASVRIEATDRAGLERLIRGHRRGALVLLGRPSPSTDSTWSAIVPTRSSTSSQRPTSPAAPRFVSQLWSSWTAWPRSSPLPASTVTATTAFSPPTHR